MSAELIDLVQRLGQPRVLVIGDVMLDRYIWGDADRISQEAPVILLRADRREERLGGASTLPPCCGHWAPVSLSACSEPMPMRRRCATFSTNLGIDMEGVVGDPARPTTVKERYIGRAQHRHPQQMLRVDFETREPVSGPIERELSAIVMSKLREVRHRLVSDYDKGVCTPAVMAMAISGAQSTGI